MLTQEDRLVIEEWHNGHLELAETLRSQMADDLEQAKTDNSLEVLLFDFQKILSLPKLSTSIVYYKRQLNLYNFGLHVGSTNQAIFNVWNEMQVSKGTQEVGSCLKKHIQEINGPKKLILWSDSCGGQNRSIKLILMLIHILQNHDTLDTISIRYLQSGHSYLLNDSDFSDFECALKQHEQLFTEDEFISVMESSRIDNKFIVNRMTSDDFFSVASLELEVTNRKIDTMKNKVSWLSTHKIVLEKSQLNLLKMRQKLDGSFQTVDIKKRGGVSNIGTVALDNLWPNGRSLSKDKVNDLKEILKLVPDEHKHFYSFLDTIMIGNFTDIRRIRRNN